MLQLWVNLEMIDKGCFKEGKSEKQDNLLFAHFKAHSYGLPESMQGDIWRKETVLVCAYVFVQTWTDFSWQKEGCESSYF